MLSPTRHKKGSTSPIPSNAVRQMQPSQPLSLITANENEQPY